jgi:hypothetical protein
MGCSLLKKKGTADGGDSADAATVTVTGTGAKNEKDVLRYASEVKLANEPGTVGKDGTKVKTFPATGADVATLANGTPVTKIASYFSTGVLVIFSDPSSTDGSKLMGWITPEALVAAPVVATTTATARPAVAAGTVTKTATAVDSGAAVVDAGAAAVATAAGATSAATKPSAVAPPAALGNAVTVVPAAGNVCPAGMIFLASLCRRPCGSDADCPKGSGATCKLFAGKKTCSR